MSKAAAIIEVAKQTAEGTAALLNKMPKGKNFNAFHKKYTRMPTNWKRKRALIMAQVATTAVSGAMELAMIMMQPLPTFKKGSPDFASGGSVILPNYKKDDTTN